MEFDTIHQATQYGQLLITLQLIDFIDSRPVVDYELRWFRVMDAMLHARRCGIEAGIRIDPEQPEWPVVFIELPTGQVSWHIAQHGREWDRHTTEEKYGRIRKLLQQERERDRETGQ